jgi:hypothetical protein
LTTSRFLQFTIDEAGALLVAPTSGRRRISLRIRAQGAEVRCDGARPVVLPWDAVADSHWVMSGPQVDAWSITCWSGYKYGVAIRVSGHFEVMCRDVIAETTTLLRRYHQWVAAGILRGHALPLVPVSHSFAVCYREQGTLRALTRVLCGRSDLRERIVDPDRLRRLATDLSFGLLPWPSERTGARRDTIDIVTAMRHAGFVHALGRPLSANEIAPLHEVVAGTRLQLEANRYREGRHVDDALIAAVARRNYLDVEPWPFAALVL